jgi:uncharacterized membrane protein
MIEDYAGILRALHLLGVVAWVGGMAFALFVLRPGLGLLPPAQRLTLHRAVFTRFFAMVWVAMPAVVLSGYAMVFAAYGGFAGVNPLVHVMSLIGLIMAAVFLVIFFGPWRHFRAAQAAADSTKAATCVERIRHLVHANLVLGTIAILCGAFI